MENGAIAVGVDFDTWEAAVENDDVAWKRFVVRRIASPLLYAAAVLLFLTVLFFIANMVAGRDPADALIGALFAADLFAMLGVAIMVALDLLERLLSPSLPVSRAPLPVLFPCRLLDRVVERLPDGTPVRLLAADALALAQSILLFLWILIDGLLIGGWNFSLYRILVGEHILSLSPDRQLERLSDFFAAGGTADSFWLGVAAFVAYAAFATLVTFVLSLNLTALLADKARQRLLAAIARKRDGKTKP